MGEQQTSLTEQNAAQLKILVNSANEAVELIKQRFGDQAKVLSVKQQEASGLKRLIHKPKLEVIVEVPKSVLEKGGKTAAPEPEAPTAPKPEVASQERAEKAEKIAAPKASPPISKNADPERETAPAAEKKSKPARPISSLYSKNESEKKNYFGDLGTAPKPKAAPQSEAPLGSAANPVRRGTLDTVKRTITMLESVGFDRMLIERIRYDLDFRDIGELPAMEMYGRICDWLHSNFPDNNIKLKGNRRAFIGTSGSGKTGALCKSLSADVFIAGLEPSVLKVDSEMPNSSDGLEAFCEIVGTELARSADEIQEISPARPLYIDMPGVNINDNARVDQCAAKLDELEVDERVLVVNAAYDADLIAASFSAASRMGATHVVFTHLDETIRVGKLWKFALSGGLKPLFFSYGPNPAGDYEFDTFSLLLEKTFPHGKSIASKNKRSAQADAAATQANEEAIARV